MILSRRDPELIKTLFELEVPEIADGLVEIRGVAREPGYRSKIAVESHAQGVDPVGACVGPRGSRVRMVVSELRGEKIDIIPWNTEPARFVAKALSPARVREVYIDDDSRDATVVVPGRPARARDRQGGPERPPRRAAHRLEGRHRLRHRVRAAGGRGCVRRRGRRRLQRPLRRDPRERQALSEHVAARAPASAASPAHQELAKIEAQTGEYAPGTVTPTPRRRGAEDDGDDARPSTRLPSRPSTSRRRGDRPRRRRSSRSRPTPYRAGGPGACCVRSRRSARAPAAAARRRSRSCSRFAAVDGELTQGRTLPGRGAYTCRRLLCFERAVARPRLQPRAQAERRRRSGAQPPLH